MKSKLKVHERANTLGLSQLESILKVFDGALGSYKKAKVYFQTNKLNEGSEELEKAKKFVTRLHTTLDSAKSREIAKKLGNLYNYVINQTNLAQATKELKIIDDNISVLGNLREGWSYLQRKQKSRSPDSSETENVTESKLSNSD